MTTVLTTDRLGVLGNSIQKSAKEHINPSRERRKSSNGANFSLPERLGGWQGSQMREKRAFGVRGCGRCESSGHSDQKKPENAGNHCIFGLFLFFETDVRDRLSLKIK